MKTDLQHLTDDALVLLIRRRRSMHDRYLAMLASKELYGRHASSMVRAILHICRNRRVAKDLVNLAFTKALAKYQTGGNFAGYLNVCCGNEALTWLRNRRRQIPFVDMDISEACEEEQVTHSNDIFLIQTLYSAIDSLPQQDRIRARMWMHGHSWEEIAEKTGGRMTSEESNFHRVLKKLKRLMMHRGVKSLEGVQVAEGM